MASNQDSGAEGVRLSQIVSSNATVSLPSPEESALQELWSRVFDMTAGTPRAPTTPPPTDPLGLPNRSPSPQTFRQPRPFVRSANAPPTPGSSRSRKKRKNKNEHWHLFAQEVHEGIYEAMRANSPDWWITHYLRANNYDVDEALDDMLRHVHWRRRVSFVDTDILPQGEAGAVRALQGSEIDARERKVLEGFLAVYEKRICRVLRGRDRRGRIASFVPIKNHKMGEIPTASYERFMTHHIEHARLMMGEAHGDGILLFDFVDFQANNMDFRPLKAIIHLMKDIYPQGLGDVIMHRVPPLFMSVWALIRKVVRPEYLIHIHFTRDLSDLLHWLPLESLPREVGGEHDDYSYEGPNLDDPMNGGGDESVQSFREHERLNVQRQRAELIRLFEETTKEWIDATRQGRETKGLRALRDKYSKDLTTSYWELDPYTRARSNYDRLGWLTPPPAKQV